MAGLSLIITTLGIYYITRPDV